MTPPWFHAYSGDRRVRYALPIVESPLRLHHDGGGVLRGMPTSARELLAEVAGRHRLQPEALLSPGRMRHVSHARSEFFWEVRRRPRAPSLPKIASWFGFDHTSVLHGIRAHEKRMAEGKA